MENMLKESTWCQNTMKKNFNTPLIITDEDEENFNKAVKCHICDNKYVEQDIRARDHWHITGLYRGYTHQGCNDNYFKLKAEEIKIPIIFHNLRGHDSHFIM